jgi:deoxyribodipyrimidine photo-lyase
MIQWIEGKTGYPLVDAAMRELKQTGWMSNRGRQNVASFLVHGLKLPWSWGEAYFQTTLLDYDRTSNLGNWQYLAGVGADPRENRVFNVTLQFKKYDAQGVYVKRWLPELKHIPVPLMYQPWTMNSLQQSLYQCELGKDYPIRLINDPRFFFA